MCIRDRRTTKSLKPRFTEIWQVRYSSIACVEAPNCRSDAAKAATVVVLDMAAVVHMVRPTSAHTFRDYVSQHLVPFVESQITPTVTRVDAI